MTAYTVTINVDEQANYSVNFSDGTGPGVSLLAGDTVDIVLGDGINGDVVLNFAPLTEQFHLLSTELTFGSGTGGFTIHSSPTPGYKPTTPVMGPSSDPEE